MHKRRAARPKYSLGLNSRRRLGEDAGDFGDFRLYTSTLESKQSGGAMAYSESRVA